MALSRSTKARWERIILIGRGLCNNVFYEEMTHCKFISLVGLHSLIVKLYIVYPDPSIHLQGIMFIKSLLYLQICQIVFFFIKTQPIISPKSLYLIILNTA